MLHFNEIQGRVEIGPFVVEPLPVVHGRSTTYGYRLESAGRTVGYVPDCKEMSDETVRRLAGVDVMVLDGLRHRPHPTHVTVAESTELLRRIGAKRSYLTHMCHELDHEETQESLPLGVFVSCGMTIEW
jgi:phosphoribosyl 1,2-cyclic phosphate phosphodiesterase